jgi:hypothetical protein
LGWLLLPQEQIVEIWPGRQFPDEHLPVPKRLEGATKLEGGTLLLGLLMDLEEIWRG